MNTSQRDLELLILRGRIRTEEPDAPNYFQATNPDHPLIRELYGPKPIPIQSIINAQMDEDAAED